ncbi:integrase catalytic domain-containing protein [Trichonephila inaurata madagascariensis]|uniref:Integrase catalytic domain-containing protein n=1 Tax=Trichonephila inaurata madagascariensis TaxID=2747483 RepID=A0A8X6IXJ8_9ARAC|nr:integrase catalytic domain-containing protein [Trichonephila inaurata madagascariensis]
MEASEEIKEKIIFWKTKLSSKIRRINSDSIQVDTVSRNIQVIDSNSFECMNINLPKLQINKNSTDIVGLRNLYDRAETQIRSLESLGVKGESYSNLLTPILLKQIPSELVLEFNRSQKDEGFDLSALLRFLHLEIRSRERASQINNHKPCHYSPPLQDRTKNKGSYFPLQRMKPPLNTVQSGPHSFSTLLGKVEPRGRKCLYCNKGHELDACRSFSANEKREILRKKGCCYLCLTPGHRAMECVERESCRICNGPHHFSICFRNRHDDLSPKRDTDNIVSAVFKTEVNSVLLQTCAALIDDKNEQVVRLFLDNGSQRTDSYEFNDKEIPILIGADYYYQVVTGRITRLNEILVAVETLFGWSLQGQSADHEELLTMSVIVNESNVSKQLSEFWDLENLGIEAEVSDV